MSGQFFSLVLQKSPEPLVLTALVDEVAQLTTPIGVSVQVLREGMGDEPSVLNIGGAKISVIAKPEPVPVGTMEGAAHASISWPGAKDAIAEHRAHIIVGCLDLPKDHEQAIHFAVMTTLTTAAVLKQTNGAGVYWSTGQLMVAPDSWTQAVQTILAKNLPVEDWVNLYWSKNEEGSIGAVTEGARAFFGMEIELLPSRLAPADVAGRLFGVVRYLLANGAVLKDGDTLGQSETETIRVRFKDRGAQFDGPVIQLSLETIQPKSSTLPGLGGVPYPTSKGSKNGPVFGKRGRR